MELLVAADDRTGATETAAALVERGAGDVAVVGWPSTEATTPVGVVDLGSRHLSPSAASQRAASMDRAGNGPQRQAHKIDSTLRGNWAEELVARTPRRPVMLIPALPALGRTCVEGVVLEHGRPVHEGSAGSDVRRRVVTSRPRDMLRAAGADTVVELSGVDHVAAWLEQPSGVAVADADTDARISAMVDLWSETDAVLLAGSSAVIGAAAGDPAEPPHRFPPVDGPVLVVCGSVHPVARAQLLVAEHHGIVTTYLADDLTARTLADADALVLASEIPVGDIDEPLAIAAASVLARGVADLSARVRLGALVIIGGDTAAAVIGDAATTVHGEVGPGTPWMSVDGIDVPVVTRAGGFGSDHALLDLIRGMRR